MHPTFTIRAKWIWTGSGPPIADGSIEVRNHRIVSLSTQAPPSAIDLGSHCILPGLINSHTHFEFSDLRTPVAAGDNFAAWILQVVQRRQLARSTSNIGEPSSEERGLIEAYSSGTRLALDIATTSLRDEEDENAVHRPAVVRFAELIGTTPLRARQTWQGAFRLRQSARQYRNDHRVSSSDDATVDAPPHLPAFGLSPHAPYTTTAQLIRQAVARCQRWKVPLMMHLAESRDEVQWIEEGNGPLQELLELVVGPDLLSIRDRLSMPEYVFELCRGPLAYIVHGNYLDDASMSILETHRAKAAVVYCPRTHAHFDHATYPLEAYHQRGIRVVLGTDSRASNPDLSIFEEARQVRCRHPQVSAESILAMITTLPADVIGCESEWGSIRPGCRAELNIVPCQATRASDVLEEILRSDAPVRPLEPLSFATR